MSYPEEISLKAQASRSIIPTQIIFHSLANGWNFEDGVGWLLDPSNPLEAHIAVRKDGLRRQLVPYTMPAEANYHANRRPDGTGALSAETDSSVDATEPWTDDQVASLIEWAIDRCREFAIPPRLCRTWDDPGLGWHIMFGSPGEWTPARKVCPGPARIAQVRDVIVPAVAAALAGPPGPIIPNPTIPTTPEDNDMPLTDNDIDRIAAKLLPQVLAGTRESVNAALNANFGPSAVNNPRSILNTGFMRRFAANFETRWGRGLTLGGKKI